MVDHSEPSVVSDTDRINSASVVENEGETRSIIPRLTLKRIAVLVGLAILTVGLMLSLGGGRAAVDALLTVDPRFILLAIMVHYSGFAVRGH